jgi:hypothetical protein
MAHVKKSWRQTYTNPTTALRSVQREKFSSSKIAQADAIIAACAEDKTQTFAFTDT